MTTRSWVRNLFARRVARPIRKAPHRVRLALEALEDRTLLSTFTVNSTGDTGSGSGLTGDLRYCIAQANADNQANTILFDPTVFATPQTITLTGTQLELSDTAGTQTITGPAAGVTVSGGGLSRVFQVDAKAATSMSGLMISDGNAGSGNGGGLSNLGTATLTGCTVDGSSASGGGALYNTGTLTLNNCTVGSLAGAGNVTLGSGILTVGGDNTSTTFSGVLTGTGGLTKFGSGTLTLSGSGNTYSGITTISAGTFQAGAANAFSANSAVSLANVVSAVLDLNSFSNRIASLAGGGATGGNITLGSGTLTLADAINGSSTSYAGVLSGPGSLIVNLTATGSPVQTLSGTNTYTGTTTIEAGTLAIAADSALGTAPNSATPGSLNFNGGTLEMTAGFTLNSNRGISLGAAGGTLQTDTGIMNYGGIVAGSGSLNKSGSGTLILSGANAYTGTTIISAGTLAATDAGALGSAGGGTILITPSAGDTAILDLSSLASLTNTSAITFDSSAASSIAQLNTKKAITLSNAISLTGSANNFNVLASTTQLAGAITGTGGLTELGAGILLLNGTSNTYSGTTTIDAGTFQAGAANAFSAASAVSLANAASAVLDLNSFSNSIAALAGGGATGGNAKLASGTLTIANALSGSKTTYAGVLSGTGSLIINLTGTGSPVQTLSGTDTYKGTTTIEAGTLAATAAGALGPAGGGTILITPSASNTAVLDLSALASLTNSKGAMDFNSSAASSTAQLNTSAAITLSNAIGLTGSTNQFNVASNTTQLGGAITGTGGLTKLGSGTLQLSGTNNTYTGATTINAGTLAATAAGALGPASGGTILITPSAGNTAILDLSALAKLTNTNAINLNSSTASSTAQMNTSSAITLSNAIGLTGPVDQFNVAANTTQLAGAITGMGGLTELGAGILLLNGTSNTYSGTTTVNAGTLQAGATNAFSAASAVNLANVAGAILNLNNFSNSIASLAGGGATGGNVTLGSGTLTLTNAINGSSTSYAGVLSGTGSLIVNLTATGSPVQTLSGTNTYTGKTTIEAGTLAATAAGALGPAGGGTILITPSAGNTAILDLSTLASLTNTKGAMDFNSSAASSTAQLDTSTAITLSNAIGLAGSTNQFNVAANTTQLAGAITGAGGLTKLGSGTLQLNGTNNTYTGATTINAGTLAATAAGALGPASGGTILIMPSAANTAILDLSALASLTNTNAINFNSSAASSTAQLYTSTGITFGNAIGLTGSTDQFNVAANTTELAGAITGTAGWTKLGAGILLIAGNNTNNNNDGSTNIAAGIVLVGSATALGSAAAVTVAAGAALGLNDVMVAVATLAGAGNVNLASSGSCLTVGGGGLFSIFSGIISGLGCLTAGGGILSLLGASTFTGLTTVAAGTLLVDGALAATGTVLVDSGATLGGAGTVGSITADGIVSPGGAGSPAILNAAEATFNPGSTLAVKLNGTMPGPGGYDQLNVTGPVNLNNPTLDPTSDFKPTIGEDFTIIKTGEMLTGEFKDLPNKDITDINNEPYENKYGQNDAELERVELTTTTLSSSSNPSVYGQSVTFTATVAPVAPDTGTPAGTVIFTVNGVPQLPTILSDGQATLSTTTLGVGTNSIGATYSGDGAILPSISSPLTHTVNQADTMTTLTSSSNPSQPGQSVTFTATVSAVAPGAGMPTGNVVFTIDGVNTTEALNSLTGQATFSTSDLKAGAHTVFAAYQGDSNFKASTSASLTQQVQQAGFVWTGDNASTSNWSDPANWQGGMAPTGTVGEVIFPAGAARLTNTNDVSGLTIQSIDFSGNTYAISGNAITLTGGITADAGATGSDAFNLNISLPGTPIFTVTNAGAVLTLGGSLSGAGGLTEAGAGTLVLSGANDYTGATTITAGTLQVGAGGTSGTLGRGAIVDDGTLVFNRSDNALAVSAVISGSGALTQAGRGTTTLTAANTYMGATTINAGTLQLGVNNALPSGTAVSLADVAGAMLDLHGFGTSIASLAGGGNVTLGMGTLTIANTIAMSSSSYTGIISGMMGGLVINLTGMDSPVQTLSGTNTYTGTTTINAGTLAVTAAGALGPVGGGNILITPSAENTAILDLSGLTSLTNTTGAINLDSSANASGADLDTSLAITLGNAIELTGMANNFYVAANITQLGGALTGMGNLSKFGSGTLQLNGTNNMYIGTMDIANGSLAATAPDALGPANGGAISIDPNTDVTAILDLSTLTSLTNTNAINFNSTAEKSSAQLNTKSTITLSNAIGLTGSTNLVNVNSNTTWLQGTTLLLGAITGMGDLTMDGPGTLVLAGPNNYMGATTINAGTLQVGDGGTLGMGPVHDNGTLVFNHSDALTVSTAIDGSGALPQAGAGTLTLTAANSYVGATTLWAGTLLVNGSLAAAGTVMISSGATLGGAGAVGTIMAAGVVSPGGPASSAILKAGNTTFDAGSAFMAKLNSTTAGSGCSQLNVTGTVDLSGSPSLNATASFEAAIGDTFTIITASGGLSGTFNGLPNNSTLTISGDAFRINYDSNSVKLTRTQDTFEWTGSSGTTSNWSDGANWQGGLAPTGPIVMLIFPAGAARLTNTNNVSGLTIQSIDFSGNGYAISGNAITLTGGITLDSGVMGTDTFNLNIGLPAVQTFTVSDAGETLALGGSLSGAGGLIEAGAGTLTLSGANTYRGGTTISAGTLQIGAGGTSGTLGTGAIVDDATLVFDRSDALTVSADIFGSGTLTQAGSGTLTLSGANTYRGGTTISAGTLQIGAGGTSGTLGTGAIVDDATLVFDRSDALTVSADIFGSGTLTQAGSGTLTLSGDNDYMGTTTIIDGILAATAVGALGQVTGGEIVIRPTTGVEAILDLTALSSQSGLNNISAIHFDTSENSNTALLRTKEAITLDNPIDLTGPVNSFQVLDNVTQLSGTISGTGGLTKLGAGTLELNGTNNTYTGHRTTSRPKGPVGRRPSMSDGVPGSLPPRARRPPGLRCTAVF